jgi:hypothetical protein
MDGPFNKLLECVVPDLRVHEGKVALDTDNESTKIKKLLEGEGLKDLPIRKLQAISAKISDNPKLAELKKKIDAVISEKEKAIEVKDGKAPVDTDPESVKKDKLKEEFPDDDRRDRPPPARPDARPSRPDMGRPKPKTDPSMPDGDETKEDEEVPDKEYVGSNGEDKYFYFTKENGMAIVDAEGVKVYPTDEREGEVTDIGAGEEAEAGAGEGEGLEGEGEPADESVGDFIIAAIEAVDEIKEIDAGTFKKHMLPAYKAAMEQEGGEGADEAFPDEEEELFKESIKHDDKTYQVSMKENVLTIGGKEFKFSGDAFFKNYQTSEGKVDVVSLTHDVIDSLSEEVLETLEEVKEEEKKDKDVK